MKLRILGCSGGIGDNAGTTSMLLDNNTLIDAGTGLGKLSLNELSLIDHIFISHSHLDHIAMIPMLVDTVGAMRSQPITLYAIPPTIAILKEHIFNWKIWPDFTQIPDQQAPFMRYRPIAVGETISLNDQLAITALPAHHTVPAVGYRMDSGKNSVVYSGDTTTNDAFWDTVNNIDNLATLIIETAFCNRERALAVASKHLCPSLLATELTKLKQSVNILITHLKPGETELTMQEVQASIKGFALNQLRDDQILEL